MPDLCVRNKQTKAGKDKTKPDNRRKSNKIMRRGGERGGSRLSKGFSQGRTPFNSQVTADVPESLSSPPFSLSLSLVFSHY